MIEWGNKDGKPPKGETPTRFLAFSLIELLVVIAVIGLLAGILLGIMPGVQHRKVMSRVETELKQLEAAIEYYKEKNGFYPPDNVENIAEPPLFYELVGTTNNATTYYPLNVTTNISGATSIQSSQIQSVFGTEGFLNTGQAGEVQNFYRTLKESQYNQTPFDSTRALVLTVPAKGPRYPGNPGTERTNTWRYIVAKQNPTNPVYPTNNPGSYDLWAEVVHRGRTYVVGNWKK